MSKRTIQLLALAVFMLMGVSLMQGQMRQGKLGLGLSASGYILQFDFKSMDPSFGGALDLSYSIREHIGVRSSLGVGNLSGTDNLGRSVTSNLFYGSVYFSANLMPHERFDPYAFIGAGLVYFVPRLSDGSFASGKGDVLWDVNLLGGVGLDYFLDEYWAINFRIEGALTNSDGMDGLAGGSTKDLYQRVSVGLRYHFFDESFVRKMIEAFEKRGK